MKFENYRRELEFRGAYPMRGTLCFPASPPEACPAVLFLHGSGPVDRNENSRLFKANTFNSLAEALAGMGWASLRYDKRGCGASGGSFWEAGFFDLVDDAQAALESLKNQPGIDPDNIVLIGHSEGCAIALAVASRCGVRGVVALAGFIGSVNDAISSQLDGLLREISGLRGLRGFLLRRLVKPQKLRYRQAKFFARIQASDKPLIRYWGIAKINAKWFREHLSHRVDDDLRALSCPLLAMVGEKDAQVTPEHSREMGTLVHGDSQYRIIPDMSHMLRRQEEPRSLINLKRIYQKQRQQAIDPRVIGELSAWLAGLTQVNPERRTQ